MPDNHSHGMLETFLLCLAPNPKDVLSDFAEKSCIEAQKIGAAFKASHLIKAKIHTWLAWQEEPGRQLHEAVKHHILKADCAYSKPFVDWFRRLYRV